MHDFDTPAVSSPLDHNPTLPPAPSWNAITSRGEVRIYKEVVTETRTVTVTVRKERIRVEHVPVTRASSAAATPGPETFQEQTFVIPLWEEEVEVKTRPVLREQVHVTKPVILETLTPRMSKGDPEGW